MPSLLCACCRAQVGLEAAAEEAEFLTQHLKQEREYLEQVLKEIIANVQRVAPWVARGQAGGAQEDLGILEGTVDGQTSLRQGPECSSGGWVGGPGAGPCAVWQHERSH